MKVSKGDHDGRLWLTLPDGTGISQEGAAVALRVPRAILVHFVEHGTLHPDAELLYQQAEARRRFIF
jgi:hypothetical protein